MGNGRGENSGRSASRGKSRVGHKGFALPLPDSFAKQNWLRPSVTGSMASESNRRVAGIGSDCAVPGEASPGTAQ